MITRDECDPRNRAPLDSVDWNATARAYAALKWKWFCAGRSYIIPTAAEIEATARDKLAGLGADDWNDSGGMRVFRDGTIVFDRRIVAARDAAVLEAGAER